MTSGVPNTGGSAADVCDVCRVLAPGGEFISVTFAQPHFRLPFLTAERYSWGVTQEAFGEASSFSYFLYAMVKGNRVSGQSVPFYVDRPQIPLGKIDNEHTHMDQEDYLLAMDL